MGTWDDPYLTMNFAYQAAIVRALGRFVEQGMVYKGKKPVHWCVHCRTALAEAEVEYEPHTSPSIYVEFPADPETVGDAGRRVSPRRPAARSRRSSGRRRPGRSRRTWRSPSIPITCTALYDGRRAPRASWPTCWPQQVAQSRTGQALGAPVVKVPGSVFEHVNFRHPLYDRASLGVLADYVTLDQGTGAVHTAPGHGADDYRTGVKYGLDIYAPVDAGGHFTAGRRARSPACGCSTPTRRSWRRWARLADSGSTSATITATRTAGAATTRSSSWRPRSGSSRWTRPACGRWRWRRSAGSRGYPAWGEDRIHNMLAHRPDWCISRQRAWGVPIPALDCTSCGEAVLTLDLVEPRGRRVRRRTAPTRGTSGRWRSSCRRASRARKCGGTAFEREQNILDVWFDSGSSHEGVLPVHAGLSLAGRHVPRGHRPVPRLVPQLAARGPRHARARAVPRGADARLRRQRGRQEDVEVAGQRRAAPADHRPERRRGAAPLGRDDRLSRRGAHRQGDPRAHRRGVPEAAQHAALLRGQPLRLRPGHRSRAGRTHDGDRPLRAGPLRRGRAEGPARPTTRTTSRRSSRSSTRS